jgi:hypothetical protein
MPNQTKPEPPTEAAQTEDAPTFSALIQKARCEAATRGVGGSVGLLVARLARDDGSATVTGLRAEGFPESALYDAVTTDAKDKRVRPRAKLGIVAGEPMVWLTTTGWQAAGKPSGRERPPSAESAIHAAAPGYIDAWLQKVTGPWPGLDVRVVTGEPCRSFSEQVKSLAWSRIQLGDTTGEFGPLSNGLLPDALIVERYPNAQTYEGAWGRPPDSPDDVAEQVLALEIEDTRKASNPLLWKVNRWDTTCTRLGAAVRVVWVVRTAEIRDRLVDLGVGTERRPAQLLVAGARIDLPKSQLVAAAGTDWWPVGLWEQAQRSALTGAA